MPYSVYSLFRRVRLRLGVLALGGLAVACGGSSPLGPSTDGVPPASDSPAAPAVPTDSTVMPADSSLIAPNALTGGSAGHCVWYVRSRSRASRTAVHRRPPTADPIHPAAQPRRRALQRCPTGTQVVRFGKQHQECGRHLQPHQVEGDGRSFQDCRLQQLHHRRDGPGSLLDRRAVPGGEVGWSDDLPGHH